MSTYLDEADACKFTKGELTKGKCLLILPWGCKMDVNKDTTCVEIWREKFVPRASDSLGLPSNTKQ